MPGQLKTVSVSTVPPSRPPNCNPMTVTHGNQRILQGMPDNHDLLFESLGARRGDIVLGQGLHHAGSRITGKHGHEEAGQGYRRHKQELDPAAASHGQPLQFDGEHHDEHQPQPEGRHGNTEKGQGCNENIPKPCRGGQRPRCRRECRAGRASRVAATARMTVFRRRGRISSINGDFAS